MKKNFRRETIPHVFGPDRLAIIQRRQDRLFRDTPYRHYDIQGREEDARRDDRILLTAITNAGIITPWGGITGTNTRCRWRALILYRYLPALFFH